MVKEIEGTIKSIAVLSDNDKYRYSLKRVWDCDKQNATVIMLNPSKADMLKTDRTVMNLTNFFIEKKFGAITIVNLFSYMTTNPALLNQRDIVDESLNDSYIKRAFNETDIIIVAWVRDKNKYVTRKREVENLLIGHRNKIKCFEDSSGRKLRHPRDLGADWKLVDYEFMFI